MKKKPKIPRAVIGTVLVFVVLLSVFMAGHDLWRQKQAQDTFEDLADLVTAPEDPEESQAESSAPEEFAEARSRRRNREIFPYCLSRTPTASAGSASPAQRWTIR